MALYLRELGALLRATLSSLRATADSGRHNRWTNGPFLTNPPALVVNPVVAVMPHFVVVMPVPIAWHPNVINSSTPIAGSVDIIRPIANPDGDIHRVSRRR